LLGTRTLSTQFEQQLLTLHILTIYK